MCLNIQKNVPKRRVFFDLTFWRTLQALALASGECKSQGLRFHVTSIK